MHAVLATERFESSLSNQLLTIGYLFIHGINVVIYYKILVHMPYNRYIDKTKTSRKFTINSGRLKRYHLVPLKYYLWLARVDEVINMHLLLAAILNS